MFGGIVQHCLHATRGEIAQDENPAGNAEADKEEGQDRELVCSFESTTLAAFASVHLCGFTLRSNGFGNVW